MKIGVVKLLPLQGVLLIAVIPRAMPWARSFCPFRACCFWSFRLFRACCFWSFWSFCPFLNHMRKFCQGIPIINSPWKGYA